MAVPPVRSRITPAWPALSRRLPLSVALSVIVLGGCAAEGEELPARVQAQLPLVSGELYELCPVTDTPREHYNQEARTKRRRLEALIREVRRRPDAIITREFEDAHSGERHKERLSVRDLAREHLGNPGIKGVPCARRQMARLQNAVEPGRKTRELEDERVFLIDEVVRALRLRQDGTIYTNRHCREVQQILTAREEVQISERSPIENIELIASPDKTVGIEAFKPTPQCRRYLERRLALLEAGP